VAIKDGVVDKVNTCNKVESNLVKNRASSMSHISNDTLQ
jgi:hypothetical protein